MLRSFCAIALVLVVSLTWVGSCQGEITLIDVDASQGSGAAQLATKHDISLKYWNGRGLMEISRMILAVGGQFPPADYNDGRFDTPPGDLDANLGRMPVMHVDGADIGQSLAIYYYLATEYGLMGASTTQAAQILSIYEHVREMMLAYRAIIPYGEAGTDEDVLKWFEGGASDSQDTAVASMRTQRYLTWYMGRIERALQVLGAGPGGFAVGNKLSLADLVLYNAFEEHLRPEEHDESMPEFRQQPFGALDKVQKKLQGYPRIRSSIDAVAKNGNIQKWLGMRGVQGF